ncbi:MAG: DCC1-like thiol-disulfide oxidoreductase family protein [Pseudomonadota bacterium]
MGSDLIVFDGTCVFCSGFARFIAKHDTQQRFRFVTAHSPTGRQLYEAHGLDPDLMETNIVIVDGEAHIRMAAFAAAMSALGWPWKALSVVNVLPRGILDWVYDRMAKNRYRFGRRACPVPSPELRARLVE